MKIHDFHYSRRLYFFLVFLIFLIAVLRNPGVFLYPSFWAEDATYFFKDSIEVGARSIVTPIQGHYHVIPRMIAYFATFFSIQFAPLIYAICAALVSSFCFSVFFRPGCRWILGSDCARFISCVAFSLMPGTLEVNYALCTLNYAVFTCILFLLIEKTDETFGLSVGKGALLSFLWFSAGQSAVVFPGLFLMFLYSVKRGRENSKQSSWGTLLALATLLFSLILNVIDFLFYQKVYAANFSKGSDLFAIVRIIYDHFFVRYFYLPVLGTGGLKTIFSFPEWLFAALSFGLLGWAFYYRSKNRISIPRTRVERFVLVYFAFCPLFLWALTAGVRMEPALLMRPHFHAYSRYTVISSVVTLCLFQVYLSGLSWKQKWRYLKPALVVFVFFRIKTGAIVAAPEEYTPFLSTWQEKAQSINLALNARRKGTLRQTVEVRDILARPGHWWGSIDRLKISPDP